MYRPTVHSVHCRTPYSFGQTTPYTVVLPTYSSTNPPYTVVTTDGMLTPYTVVDKRWSVQLGHSC